MAEVALCKSCEGCDLRENVKTKIEQLEAAFNIQLGLQGCEDYCDCGVGHE